MLDGKARIVVQQGFEGDDEPDDARATFVYTP
jgi:hypothetical protein